LIEEGIDSLKVPLVQCNESCGITRLTSWNAVTAIFELKNCTLVPELGTSEDLDATARERIYITGGRSIYGI
jgi:hypothetical protein